MHLRDSAKQGDGCLALGMGPSAWPCSVKVCPGPKNSQGGSLGDQSVS